MKRTISILLLKLTLVCGPSAADSILLNNGDHITGKVVSLQDGILTVTTGYAGTVKIKWLHVTRLETDRPLQVHLPNRKEHARLRSREDGMLELMRGDNQPVAMVPMAQVSAIVERGQDRPRRKITAHVDASLESTSGNSEIDRLYTDAEIRIRGEKNRLTLGLESKRTREYDSDTENNITAQVKYDRFLTEKWYAYGNSTFTKDDFRDLDLRSSLGAGAGYQVWETESRNLSLEAGLEFVNEDYAEADNEDYVAARWAVDFDQWVVEGIAQFFHKHEGLFGLDTNNDVIVRSKTGLRFPLGENFTATAQLNWDWDQSPAPGTGSTDKTWLVNIGYHIR